MKLRFTTLLIILIFSIVNGQLRDSLQVHQSQKWALKSVYAPTGLMVSGILANNRSNESLKTESTKSSTADLFGFTKRADDYLQLTPFVAVYGFELIGMEPKTDWKNRTAILIKGQLMNLGTVYLLKKSLKLPRPDGTAFSFPSGHTANAFAGATMLTIEYGEDHPWVPYAAYGLATGVGFMRMGNNKHYLSDVLFGAGLGILSMKIAYWTHQYRWNTTKEPGDPFTRIYQSSNF